MIEFDRLTKRFGELIAVNQLTLRIPQGELFAFLGPNGAGKTSTIKLLAGLLKPTSGTIRLCGADVQTDYVRAKTYLSYIPDVPFVYEKLTGREFIYFILNVYPIPDRGAALRQADELLSVFGIEKHQHHLIEQYSHGMRQKLIFTAALIHQPRILVIDEPMVGLDPHATRIVKGILTTQARNGTTVFLSTHALSVAEELADRIGIIDRGILVAVGTLAELSRSVGLQGKLEDVFLRLTSEEPLP